MSALVQSFLLACSVFLTYVWLQIPALSPYSLQVFALLMLIYFGLKRLNKAKLWHLAPAAASIEMPVLTFAFLLLIGSTGNFNSPFFALTFVHLFFVVLSSEVSAALITSVMVMLFHYSLSHTLTTQDLTNSLSIPIVMVFYLFAKYQYQEAQKDQVLLAEETEELELHTSQEEYLKRWMSEFALPKLIMLQQLSESAVDNKDFFTKQLALLQDEFHKALGAVEPPTPES